VCPYAPYKPLIENLGYRLEPRSNGNYAIHGLSPEIVLKDHYWVCPDTGAAGNAIDIPKVRRSILRRRIRADQRRLVQ
jgi:hypothetical protein